LAEKVHALLGQSHRKELAADLLSQHLVEEGRYMRNTAGRWLTATAVVGGLLFAGSPAIAAQAAPVLTTQARNAQHQARAATPKVAGVKAVPDVVGDSSPICLTTNTNYCIKSDGPGNQVTITDYAPNVSNFTVVRIKTIVGITYYQWQNGNGNCLREGTNSQVKLEHGGCVSTDDTDWWHLISGTSVENESTFDFMQIHGRPATGDGVFAQATIPAGDWYQWNVPK
jgi:hypothetical protein